MPLSSDNSAYANKWDLTQISAEKKCDYLCHKYSNKCHTKKKEKIAQKSVLRDQCGSIAVWSF